MLLRGLIIASIATRLAIHQTILANADIELRLAKATELFAFALSFGPFALGAAVFGLAGSGIHMGNLAWGASFLKYAISNA
jgi:hypothetical protein